MNSIHDPYDPNSPAADFHHGSPETMDLLDPVPIILDPSDEPDMPVRLPDIDDSDPQEDSLATCSDPVRDSQTIDAEEAGYL